MLWKRFYMDCHTLLRSKSKHFTWRVVQKSIFVLCEWSCNLIDVRDGFLIDLWSILDWFWEENDRNFSLRWHCNEVEAKLEAKVAKQRLAWAFWRLLEPSWGGFCRVLQAPWGGFSIYLDIFFRYSFRNGFFYAFETILYGFSYPPKK